MNADELCIAHAFQILSSLPGYRGAVIIVNTTAGGEEKALLKSSLPGHMAVRLVQRIAQHLSAPGSTTGPARLVLPS